jgi:hypothetical protein
MTRRGAWRRDPIREKFGRRTIRSQRRSGLTVRAFCPREGLKDGPFHWRRPALACRDRERPRPSHRAIGMTNPPERPRLPPGKLIETTPVLSRNRPCAHVRG